MAELTLFGGGAQTLGASLQVSAMGWGMWRLAGEDVHGTRTNLETALACGINLLDTADVYGGGQAETLLGHVLSGSPELRRRIVLATKGGIRPGVPYDSSAGYLMQACEASLRRLQTERVELYQIHRPDVLTHPAEIADVLVRLRTAGKIAEVGVSNFTASQVSALQHFLPFQLASIQPEYSALCVEPLGNGILDQALVLDMRVLAWSPLAGGRLVSGAPPDERAAAVISLLDRAAAAQSVSRSAVALAWVMAHPSRPIPLIGSQSSARIREAAQAAQVIFTRSQWYEILSAARGAALP